MELITGYYKYAELTYLVFKDKITKKYFHIFSVIDLIPNESSTTKQIVLQQISIPKNNAVVFYLDKIRIDLETALSFFNAPIDNLKIDGNKIHFLNILTKEPAGIQPLIIPGNIYNKSGLAAVTS